MGVQPASSVYATMEDQRVLDEPERKKKVPCIVLQAYLLSIIVLAVLLSLTVGDALQESVELLLLSLSDAITSHDYPDSGFSL